MEAKVRGPSGRRLPVCLGLSSQLFEHLRLHVGRWVDQDAIVKHFNNEKITPGKICSALSYLYTRRGVLRQGKIGHAQFMYTSDKTTSPTVIKHRTRSVNKLRCVLDMSGDIVIGKGATVVYLKPFEVTQLRTFLLSLRRTLG
jgi:short subunit dehydrogenase-like uncharacterized protein